ncbi:MAG TPA: DUF1015 domain-containing protein [Nitrospirales bacterium]|nr:DUF1015 domain-containing protein [Nitrospirales bacterium]
MATIIPFRGVLYDPTVVGDISKVVAPPYDIIDDRMQKVLHDRHPNNIVRIELGLDQPGDSDASNRYTRAAASLKAWRASGALRRDPQPAVYLYTIDYRPPGAEPGSPTRTLRGFLSTVQLEEFGSGHIYPHENTRSAAKADRLNLMEHCHANISPIWSLFSDPDGRVMDLIQKAVDVNRPRFEFTDDEGCRQRLWSVTDPSVLREVVSAMSRTPLFIADGHHRYETALRYRQVQRERGAMARGNPFDAVLMLLGSLEDQGLTVLPTHRILATGLPPLAEIKTVLKDSFEFEEFPFESATEADARRRFLSALRTRGQSQQVFGLALYDASTYLLLALRRAPAVPVGPSPQERLDVSVLHSHVLNRLKPRDAAEHVISYTKDEAEALGLVRGGQAKAALLLNATKVSEVSAVAKSGGRMPHKSTYFFPKPLTGLVLNPFDNAG